MRILIDSREQAALEFDHPYITETQTVHLSVGDYGVEYEDGFIPPIFFERKSLGDLFGTMGGGYKRFKKELERSKVLSVNLILIIEGSFTQVLKGYKHSSIKGISIIRKLFTLWLKYDLGFVLTKDRDEMSQYITEYYCSLGRLKGKRNPSNGTGLQNRIDSKGVSGEQTAGHPGRAVESHNPGLPIRE